MRSRPNTRKNIMNKTRDIAYIAICTSLICISAWITIPGTVPFTLQTFAIFLTLGLLGAKRGMLSILIYILIGMIGLPVFSSFNSGLGVIAGPTGGYIIGFIFSSFVYFLIEKLIKNENVKMITGFILGLIVCYAIGSIWFYYVYGNNVGYMSFVSILMVCVVPFIIPDILKLLLAFIVVKNVKKRVFIN